MNFYEIIASNIQQLINKHKLRKIDIMNTLKLTRLQCDLLLMGHLKITIYQIQEIALLAGYSVDRLLDSTNTKPLNINKDELHKKLEQYDHYLKRLGNKKTDWTGLKRKREFMP